MNTRNPLAAALLLMASPSMAQLLNLPPGAVGDKMPPYGDIQMLGQYPDMNWASPDCTHIPCAVKEASIHEAGRAAAHGIVDGLSKPAWDQKALQDAMDAERVTNKNVKLVDLGDGTYAKEEPGEMVSINSPTFCGMPVKMDTIPGLAAKFAKADAKSADQKQLQANNDKMFSGTSGGGVPAPAPVRPEMSAPTAVTPTVPETVASLSQNSDARGLGARFAADDASLNGGGGESPSASANTDVSGKLEVMKVDGSRASADAYKTGLTYIKAAEAEKKGQALIDGGAAAFGPSANASARLAEPPTNAKSQGKIQATANE